MYVVANLDPLKKGWFGMCVSHGLLVSIAASHAMFMGTNPRESFKKNFFFFFFSVLSHNYYECRYIKDTRCYIRERGKVSQICSISCQI